METAADYGKYPARKPSSVQLLLLLFFCIGPSSFFLTYLWIHSYCKHTLYTLYHSQSSLSKFFFYMYVFVSFLRAWRCIIQYHFYQIGISSFIHNSWEQNAIKDCELSRTSLHKQPQSYFCLSTDVRGLNNQSSPHYLCLFSNLFTVNAIKL